MCSILIFVKPDNIHSDPTKQWQKFGVGDVIDINNDDSFFWGNDIQGPNALGWWRVIVLPRVPAKFLQGLLSSEILNRPDTDDAPRKLRIQKLDMPLILANIKNIKLTSIIAAIVKKAATGADGLDAV